jgi:hypothetical protein
MYTSGNFTRVSNPYGSPITREDGTTYKPMPEDGGRWHVIKYTLSEWTSSPKRFFFGFGFNDSAYGLVAGHNLYLQVLRQSGLVGAILFCAIIFTLLLLCVKSVKRINLGYSLMIVCVFGALAMFEPLIEMYILSFWLVLVMFAVAEDCAKPKPETIPTPPTKAEKP